MKFSKSKKSNNSGRRSGKRMLPPSSTSRKILRRRAVRRARHTRKELIRAEEWDRVGEKVRVMCLDEDAKRCWILSATRKT